MLLSFPDCQVDASIEGLLSEYLAVPPSTIGAKVASGLTVLYLPPLPAPVVQSQPAQRTARSQRQPAAIGMATTERRPMRTSLRYILCSAYRGVYGES